MNKTAHQQDPDGSGSSNLCVHQCLRFYWSKPTGYCEPHALADARLQWWRKHYGTLGTCFVLLAWGRHCIPCPNRQHQITEDRISSNTQLMVTTDPDPASFISVLSPLHCPYPTALSPSHYIPLTTSILVPISPLKFQSQVHTNT